jgi:tape measure domain-containing protein
MAARDIEAGRAYVLITIRDRMTQGLKLAEKKLQTFGRYVGSTGAVMSATAGLGMVWPLKLSADMERASVSFETFLGSATLAKQMLSDIEMLAARTPFQFDELRDGAQLLLNFGVAGQNILPTLRMLGDVAGGDSERFSRLALAYGQVMSKGRLMGQEANQMREQGFDPLSEIARMTGKSVRQLTEDMENSAISANMVTAAFVSATGPGGRWHQLMQKQSETLYGLVSTMIDFAKMAGRALGDTLAPTFKELARYIIAVSEGVIQFIKNNQALVGFAGKTALVLGAIGLVLGGIGTAALTASFAIGVVASGILFVTSVVGFLLSPLGALVAVLSALAFVAYQFRSEIAGAVKTAATAVWPLIDAFLKVWEVARAVVEGVVIALMSGNIDAAGKIAWMGLVAIAWTAAAQMQKAIVWLVDAIAFWMVPGLDSMRKYWGATIGLIRDAIMASRWDLAGELVMTKLKGALLNVWYSIDGFWTGILTNFRLAWADSITWISKKMVDWHAWLEEMMDPRRSQKLKVIELKVAQWRQEASQGVAGRSEEEIAQAVEIMKDGMFPERQKAKQWKEELDAMNKQESAAIENSRVDPAAEEKRKEAKAKLEARIKELEGEIKTSFAQAGAPTLDDRAQQAQANVQTEIDKARKELDKLMKGNNQLPLGNLAMNANQQLGKIESKGTFSATAAAMMGGGHDAQETTARNTSTMVRLMTQVGSNRPMFV